MKPTIPGMLPKLQHADWVFGKAVVWIGPGGVDYPGRLLDRSYDENGLPTHWHVKLDSGPVYRVRPEECIWPSSRWLSANRPPAGDRSESASTGSNPDTEAPKLNANVSAEAQIEVEVNANVLRDRHLKLSRNAEALPWVGFFGRRCQAVRSSGLRCELERDHDVAIDHAVQPGTMLTHNLIRWSDDYTDPLAELVEFRRIHDLKGPTG